MTFMTWREIELAQFVTMLIVCQVLDKNQQYH